MNHEYQIAPLGAAIVEALPDQKRKRSVQNNFDKYKICPASALFTESDVVAYYAERGVEVTSCSSLAVMSDGVKASKRRRKARAAKGKEKVTA
jgi:hypothetical protein